MKSAMRSLFSIAVLCLCNSQLLLAQWSTDPAVNNAICTATGDQISPAIESDNSGGAIITWADYRAAADNADIYAQRISAGGVIQWTLNGVPICTATGNQTSPAVVSDGSGGVIITWVDSRSGGSDIYAQRISASGALQWTTGGIAVCTAATEKTAPNIISDGSGGAIIAWYNHNGSSNWNVSVQRISADGIKQWTNDGIIISAAAYNQTPPNIISDGYGGAILAWCGLVAPINIFTQRINASGAEQWTPGGVATCMATRIYGQGDPNIVSDGSGGVIIAWIYNTSGSSYSMYAQRINSNGTIRWNPDGVTIYSPNHGLNTPKLVSDDSAGAIIVWYEYRSSYTDIYAQRIKADTSLIWDAGGIRICTQSGNQTNPNIIKDGSGGAIITWRDYRWDGSGDVYAQKINAAGTQQWNAYTAAEICTVTGSQYFPILTSDSSGGAIIAWWEYRSIDPDIYAQRVYNNGSLTSVTSGNGVVPHEFTLAQNYPNPFNPSTTFHFTLPVSGEVKLVVLNILGQEVAEVVNKHLPAGTYDYSWNAKNLSSGIYFYKLTANQFSSAHKMVLLK